LKPLPQTVNLLQASSTLAAVQWAKTPHGLPCIEPAANMTAKKILSLRLRNKIGSNSHGLMTRTYRYSAAAERTMFVFKSSRRVESSSRTNRVPLFVALIVPVETFDCQKSSRHPQLLISVENVSDGFPRVSCLFSPDHNIFGGGGT
jgi:hypothetical protein